MLHTWDITILPFWCIQHLQIRNCWQFWAIQSALCVWPFSVHVLSWIPRFRQYRPACPWGPSWGICSGWFANTCWAIVRSARCHSSYLSVIQAEAESDMPKSTSTQTIISAYRKCLPVEQMQLTSTTIGAIVLWYSALLQYDFQSLLVYVQAEPFKVKIGRHASRHQANVRAITVLSLFRELTANQERQIRGIAITS